LEGVCDLISAHPRLEGVLRAPQIAEREKRALLTRLFRKRTHALIHELLQLLLEKKRFAILAEIGLAYREMLAVRGGIQRTQIVTAVPLPADLAAQLEQRLAAISGKTVALETRVDPQILGGVIVRMGDGVMDGSVRRRLQEMRNALLAAEVHARGSSPTSR